MTGGRATIRYVGAIGLLLILLVVPSLAAAGPIASPSSVAAPEMGHPATPVTVAPPAPSLRSATSPASIPSPRSLPAAPLTARPAWSSDFANDAQVTFSLPYGGGALTSFVPEPATNTIPEYVPGFWMNLTTTKQLIYANVTIWGTEFPARNVAAPIPQFGVGQGTTLPMNLSTPYTANFFFNDYRFFWPGSTVYFNVTITALNASPAQVKSTADWTFPVNAGPGNPPAQASWIYYVEGPWVSPDFNSSVNITTTPNIFGNPSTDPNPDQTLQVTLSAIAPPGLSVGTIPQGLCYFKVTKGGLSTSSSIPFGPVNQTNVSLTQAIGPYPGAEVSFNITLWLPWEGGAIDRLYSPNYQFNWSTKGGWWFPNENLTSNLELNAYPSILPPASGQVPAGQPINVSIHEPIENVTIASAQVDYIFQQGLGTHQGSLPMKNVNANTSRVIIPGLPPGSSVTFFVIAKDIYGNPVFSQNYTYSATSSLAAGIPPGHNLFFFEALDVAGTGLVPSVNFTISNATWTESRVGTSMGFAAPLLANSSSYLALTWGSYTLSIVAFGRTWSTTVVLAQNSTPFTLVYYVASGPIPEETSSALPLLPISGALGVIGAAVATIFVVPWFRERRERIEAEQRRVTL
jgi:hypothetical protein